jgi:hypothetical protein
MAAKTSTAVATLTPAAKTEKIQKQQSTITDLRADLKNSDKEKNSAIRNFIKKDVPQIAIYSGAGAAIGGLLGYFLFDKMQEWFGAGTYVALLGTAALGIVVIVAAPSLVRVTKKSLETSAPIAGALYGFGAGVAGVGAYRAYQEWPAA